VPASTRRAPRAPPTPKTEEVGPPVEPAGAPPLDPEPSERRLLLRRKEPTQRGARPAPAARKAKPDVAWPWLDVALAAAVAVAASFAAATQPAGGARLLLGLAMLLFVPGYLLLQAFAVPAPAGKARLWQALASIGISPAVVGLLALLTSVVQGGFRLDAIVILVTLASLGFAAAALVRRRSLAHAALASSDGAPSAAAAAAATAKSGPVRP
jgi:hypothetical protein